MPARIRVSLITAALAALASSSAYGQSTFAFIGDYGINGGPEATVATKVLAENPTAILTTGDNIYGSSNYASYVGNYYGSYITNNAATNRFFPSAGNHDYSDAGINNYLGYFSGLPKNNVTNDSKYYNVKLGNVEYFMLDANADKSIGGAQYNWVNNAMRASTADWQVVVYHQPTYTYASTHPGTDGFSPAWDFKAMGADAIFNGHNHNMQAMTVDATSANGLNNGLRSFVIGTSGQGFYPINGAPNNATGDFSNANTYGYILATADATQVVTLPAKSLALGGSIITLSSASTIGTTMSASAVMTQIDASIANVTSALADIGNQAKLIDAHTKLVANLSNVLSTGIGGLTNAYTAADSARLAALQLQQQIGQQSLNIANSMPSILLSLFK
jgi:flagellin-like hook-associated protein FlgL